MTAAAIPSGSRACKEKGDGHEEGWDDKNNCAGDDYSYYENVIVKDRKGNTLSCEKGSLCQTPDGIWLIS